MDIHQQAQLAKIAANWKLTPATLAQKLSRGAWIPAPWLTHVSTRVATGIARGGARSEERRVGKECRL